MNLYSCLKVDSHLWQVCGHHLRARHSKAFFRLFRSLRGWSCKWKQNSINYVNIIHSLPLFHLLIKFKNLTCQFWKRYYLWWKKNQWVRFKVITVNVKSLKPVWSFYNQRVCLVDHIIAGAPNLFTSPSPQIRKL